MYNATSIHIAVARLEANRANMRVGTLAALCRYYGISLAGFFEGWKQSGPVCFQQVIGLGGTTRVAEGSGNHLAFQTVFLWVPVPDLPLEFALVAG